MVDCFMDNSKMIQIEPILLKLLQKPLNLINP
jgi:hypothetical protein